MLSGDDLERLRTAIAGDPDHAGLLATLRARAAPVLAALPPVPRVKAMLSSDGGICPDDGATLEFDPWSPDRHRCPRCGAGFSGDRHHRYWARAQHLWLAERSAELALIGALTGDEAAAGRARELLAIYPTLYFELPNSDNVLGPSHLFFSTYLESLWVTSWLAAAWFLRLADRLPDDLAGGVDRVAEEAAGLIGEFNEGLSNRQTWHAAALTAIAAWFGDEELARSATEARTGLLGHLADGFGGDGLWYEGENYHLFALRGLMQGIHWGRAAGYDLLHDSRLTEQFRQALLGPTRSALPDFTFPARRDARYGVSLAQPASLELWEIGRTWLGGDPALDAWLGALYAVPLPLPPADHYDAWLHDAGRPLPAHRSRRDLSWWALTALGPAPETPAAWHPASVLLADQGLAVLRDGDRYASLECGRAIGGHGHPDRLHLTVHAGGVHWLPDPGAGSYVQPSLAWYRSALAHNAPRIDGRNAGGADAVCLAFEDRPGAAWCRASAGEALRTLVAVPDLLLDLVELNAPAEREVELPWHLRGEWRIVTPGRWEPATLDHPFVTGVSRFEAAESGAVVVESLEGSGSGPLRLHLLAPGAELLRATGPGLPTESGTRDFLVLRSRGRSARWVAAVETGAAGAAGLTLEGESIRMKTAQGDLLARLEPGGATIVRNGQQIVLRGLRQAPPARTPIFGPRTEPDAEALAPRIADAPLLDGSLEGFDTSAPLELDSELQYRRSEAPYEESGFSARAWANWDGGSLYLAVQVTKPACCFRARDAAPLRLDNEPEDINADGIQVYLRLGETLLAALVNPLPAGGVQVRPIGDSPALAVEGGWSSTGDGYRLTLVLRGALSGQPPGTRLGFDLLVNEMRPDRLRRAGQLVWGGDGGWIWLRGDRHDPARFGTLRLE